MFKYLRYLFFSLVIFVGLYFFGNFTVNGVNVRDYLRQKVTWNQIIDAKDKTVKVYKAVDQFVTEVNFDERAEEVVKTSKPILPESKKVSKKKVSNLPMENISKKDQEKLLKLLKDNVSQPAK
jgi:hypothetical protein